MERMVRLTNDEKILLHLLRVGQSQDDAVFNREITQDGIGECIDVSQSHVSYALKSMKKRGYIEATLSHISGIQRRRNAYFLTELGHSEALKLKRSVEDMDIMIKDLDGNVYGTKLAEFTKQKKDLNMVQVLGFIDDSGMLDVAKLERDSSARGKSDEVETPADLLAITSKLLTSRMATVIELTKKDVETAKKLRQEALKLGKNRIKKSVQRAKRIRNRVQK